MTTYIKLNRTFWPVEADKENNPENIRVMVALGVYRNVSWEHLLRKSRVVIIAEPGTGKTEELREITKRLRVEGKPAFFCRIELLQSLSFRQTFDIGNSAEFDKWLAEEQEGYFFLDSVDEARLRDHRAFEIALRRFAEAMGERINHAKVFVTCRVSQWRATSDLSMFLRLLPKQEITSIKIDENFTDQDENNLKNVPANNVLNDYKVETDQVVFQLVPLNKRQIQHFAEKKGVEDIESFMNAIDRADAMVFAERPQDLLELISFWKSKGAFGRLSEMLHFNIRVKLAEHDPDRDEQKPLSADNALLGAERLAAAITLQKKNEIILPDQPINPGLQGTAINPKKVLPDWSPDKIQTLLDRAIFDEAIYGTVRFHHRSVREYLTAIWLKQLLDKGQSRRFIDGLLFAQQYKRDVVIPSMRPIGAWLAIWNERIRNRLMIISPKVLIKYGDPSSLSIEFRKSLLIQFAESYTEYKYTGASFDITMLRRLADPQLAPIINDLLKKFSNHNDICTLSLELIWQGQITDSVDAAFSYAIDEQANWYTRSCAIRAVAASGTHKQCCSLVDALMNDISRLESRVISEVCQAFFPEILSVEQLLEILVTVKPPEQFSSSPMERSLDDIANNNLPEEIAEQLLWGLHKLIRSSPFIQQRSCRISAKYSWLLPSAIKIAHRFIKKKHPFSFDSIVLDLFLVYLTAEDYLYYYPPTDLKEILKDAKVWQEFRYQLFWHAITVARTQDKNSESGLKDWRQVHSDIRDFWVPNLNDLEPLFKDLKQRTLMDDRLVALTAIFKVYIDEGRPRNLRESMKSEIAGTPDLETKLEELLYSNPLTDKQQMKYRRQLRAMKRKKEARERQKKTMRQDWANKLKKIPEEIKNVGNASERQIWQRTTYLYKCLQEKEERSENQLGYANWKTLINEFGYEVAKNFRDGCVAFWRKYDPFSYPNHRTDNSIPWARIIGLSGLAMEAADDPEWAKHISHDEAIIAARYSVCELNGFPTWFKELYKEFPDLVDKVIKDELRWELHRGPAEKMSGHILSILRYGDMEFRERYRKFLFELLSEKEPTNDMILNDTLSVILERSHNRILRENLANLAFSRFQESSEQNRKLTWLSVLLCANGTRGSNLLKEWIASIPSVEEQKEIMIKLCATLTHHEGPHIRDFIRDYERINVLQELLPFIYQYVKPEEDPRHEGVFTPDARDDAQQTRSRLLSIIVDTPGQPSYDILINLSKLISNDYLKDRMIYLAKERAAQDAEFEPWTGEEVAEFTQLAYRQPKTQADLFKLALIRLDELKDDIENGDESEAVVLKVDQETKIRIYFANRLRKSSRGLYTVSSEEELADTTRTDIRLHTPQVSAPVPIELKIADKWTYASLLERMENQLIGQYMRISQYGVFLLVHNGIKNYWIDTYAKKIYFTELVEILKQEAVDLLKKYPNISALEVVGIDFTAR